jgi:threonine synthase
MNSLRIEGQKTASIEIAQQLGWTSPDWIVIPGGNLGNASAVGKGFVLMKELGLVDRLPRLVVAQAEHANPLWRALYRGDEAPPGQSDAPASPPPVAGRSPAPPPLAPGQPHPAAPALARGRRLSDIEVKPIVARTTLASAIQIGAPVSSRRALRALEALDGLVEQASEQELADAAARADLAGLFTCPHTGVALAALEKLAARGVVRAEERVVVISTAHGLKFSDFKLGYHEETLPGLRSPLRTRSVKLAPTLGAVQDAIAARFGRG